jgi:hypothetical protein
VTGLEIVDVTVANDEVVIVVDVTTWTTDDVVNAIPPTPDTVVLDTGTETVADGNVLSDILVVSSVTAALNGALNGNVVVSTIVVVAITGVPFSMMVDLSVTGMVVVEKYDCRVVEESDVAIFVDGESVPVDVIGCWKSGIIDVIPETILYVSSIKDVDMEVLPDTTVVVVMGRERVLVATFNSFVEAEESCFEITAGSR